MLKTHQCGSVAAFKWDITLFIARAVRQNQRDAQPGRDRWARAWLSAYERPRQMYKQGVGLMWISAGQQGIPSSCGILIGLLAKIFTSCVFIGKDKERLKQVVDPLTCSYNISSSFYWNKESEIHEDTPPSWGERGQSWVNKQFAACAACGQRGFNISDFRCFVGLIKNTFHTIEMEAMDWGSSSLCHHSQCVESCGGLIMKMHPKANGGLFNRFVTKCPSCPLISEFHGWLIWFHFVRWPLLSC